MKTLLTQKFVICEVLKLYGTQIFDLFVLEFSLGFVFGYI